MSPSSMSISQCEIAQETLQKTGEEISTLIEQIDRAADVAKVINAIASQTNLLALNTTLQAARAGEAGKCFVEVAEEVKGLASQTSEATNLIAEVLASIIQHIDKISIHNKSLNDTFGGDPDEDDVPSPPVAETREPVSEGPETATDPALALVSSEAIPDQPSTLPGITEIQKQHVQETFALIEEISEQTAKFFYDRLFKIAPELKELFKDDITEQGRKLMAMLKVAVAGLDDPDRLIPVVQALGERHKGYGVVEENYDTVAVALLWTLEKGLGEKFTPDVCDAWTAVYTLLANVMKNAAAENA